MDKSEEKPTTALIEIDGLRYRIPIPVADLLVTISHERDELLELLNELNVTKH